MTPADSTPFRIPPPLRDAALAVGRAAIPGGTRLAPFGEADLQRLEQGLSAFDPALRTGYLVLLATVAGWVTAQRRRPLARIPGEDVARTLERVASRGRLGRLALDAALAPLRIAHAGDPAVFQQLGCPHELETPALEPARWHERVLGPADVGSADDLECDVAVIGSGAGGAVVACRLAEAGLAVLVLEEGGHFRRPDFAGRPVDRVRRMYRSVGLVPLHGNTRMTLPLGRTLGGSTTVNSGTCYQAPDAVLHDWVRQRGLVSLSPDRLALYYERAAAVLEIAPCDASILGGVARVVARGCDALGYAHGPVLRNAPECDGQGVCAFGCPTGAKRSVDVSYLPRALSSGAMALVGTVVQRVTRASDGASVIHARPAGGGDDAPALSVRCRGVVFAAGTVHTPGLLQRSLDGPPAAALGRHLTVHPASMVLAVMDEPVRGWDGVPQSYAIEELIDEGLIFEGGFTPPDVAAAMLAPVGRRYTELMENYDRIAYFGAMIADRPGGRIWSRRGNDPVLTYWLGRRETLALNRGLRVLSRVFLAAGAREVIPMAAGWPSLYGDGDLRRLSRTRFGPGELDLTAFHPLGTARMGRDPGTSVVDADHRVHGQDDWWVVDGSVVPTALGVNPQWTIMAMAERAAEGIRAQLTG